MHSRGAISESGLVLLAFADRRWQGSGGHSIGTMARVWLNAPRPGLIALETQIDRVPPNSLGGTSEKTSECVVLLANGSNRRAAAPLKLLPEDRAESDRLDADTADTHAGALAR